MNIMRRRTASDVKVALNKKLWFSLGAVAVYVAAFFLFSRLSGEGAVSLTPLPVIVIGWLWGLRAGLLAGLLSIPFNILLLRIFGKLGLEIVTCPQSYGVAVSSIIIGAAVGRMRDLTKSLTKKIDEQKLAENTLKLSNEFSMTVLNGMNDAVSIINGNDFRIVRANSAFLKELGLKEEEVVGKTCYEITHHLNAPCASLEHTCPIVDSRLTGVHSVYEHVHYSKDGRKIYVEVSVSPIRNKDGNITLFVHVSRDITQRKHSEEELKSFSQKIETIINSSSDIIFLKDKDSRYLVVNEQCGKFFNLPLKDIIGKTDLDLMPEEASERCRISDEKALKSTGTIHSEEYIGGRWFHAVKQKVVDSEKNIVGIVAVIRDITERKRAEEALRENEKKFWRLSQEFLTLLDAIPDTLLLLSPDLKVQWANKGAASILHKEVSELTGQHCYKLWHNRSAPCEDCHAIRSFNTGKVEISQRSTSDGRFWDSRVFPIKEEDGKVKNVISIIRNITERKIAEEALQESEELFRQIFEQNEDALMLFKPGTCEIIDVNPAAEKLFGYKKEELIIHGPSVFVDPREFGKFEPPICGIESIKSFHIDQITNIRKDGVKIIVTARGKIIRLQNTNVVYCFFRDITEKIRMEEEARLMQAKLIQANKMTSLGTLVSGVAHEINNPNNLIMFNGQLIFDAWQDAIKILTGYYHENGDFSIGGLPFSEMREVAPKLLSGITDGSRRIKNIINNLRDFARQDKASLDGLVNINDVILASVSILNNQIKNYTEKFHYAPDENLPHVKGSAQQLEQVIINLIVNSLQALPDKECGIQIATSFNNEHVIIQVRDEGIGMSEEVLKRIGEPFFTTKLDAGGTGLGLSISYSIITEHRGSLEFESESDKGTTATVRLPRD